MPKFDPAQTFEGTIANAELSYTASGFAKLVIGFYIVYPIWNKDEKQNEEAKAYYKVTLWRDTAEEINKFAEEGRRIRMTGYAKNRRYTDRDGVEQTTKTPEIINPKVDISHLRAQAGVIYSDEGETGTNTSDDALDLL